MKRDSLKPASAWFVVGGQSCAIARTLAVAILACGCWLYPCDASQSSVTRRDAKETAHSLPHQVVLDRTATLFTSAEEAERVQKAAEDLADDFHAILGVRPKIVHRSEDSGPLTIFIGESASVPSEIRLAGLTAPESFSISLREAKWNAQRPTKVVVLYGADMRGTIYAAYQFSEKYLGIDPLYYRTDHQPARRTSVMLPKSLNETYPPPVFTDRGFFINDEDLLIGWAPGEKKPVSSIESHLGRDERQYGASPPTD